MDKIIEIVESKKILNFWELVEYMKLANYSEIESIMTSMKLFDGKVWEYVIGANVSNKESFIQDQDSLLVEIMIMTNYSEKMHIPIYKSYMKTRKYEEIPELEKNIKTVNIMLTTELGMQFFIDELEKYKELFEQFIIKKY